MRGEQCARVTETEEPVSVRVRVSTRPLVVTDRRQTGIVMIDVRYTKGGIDGIRYTGLPPTV